MSETPPDLQREKSCTRSRNGATMAQVFISYNTSDYEYAKKMFNVLDMQGIDVWFAPCAIEDGENFASKIGNELLEDDDDVEQRVSQLTGSKVLVLILSKEAQHSKWVPKEVKLAIKKGLTVLPAKVDNERLTPEFEFMLSDIQITNCYHFNANAVNEIVEKVKKYVGSTSKKPLFEEVDRFHESELHVKRIACGDPYYEELRTLFVALSGEEFYLAPPADLLAADDGTLRKWCGENGFHTEDHIFGQTLSEYLPRIPIPDLPERIESSRRKIFLQFRNRENGCYFNNKKFGISGINPFSRTLDVKESPKLEMQMFTTDYFTHRVVKDVCKQLIKEGNPVIRDIDYTHIGPYKFFLTSLGINLVLTEDKVHRDAGVLITSRSKNSAETYNVQNLSLSVIEGVSVSDYDDYQQIVSLTLAAERGLVEELNVTKDLYVPGSLRFYELFLNVDNLEIGITCSVELKKEFRLKTDVLDLHGKDQELEVADKRVIPISELKEFLYTNRSIILPQALYSFCVFLENYGILMVDRHHITAGKKQTFLLSKYGEGEPCGDCIVDDRNFIAVIDGATPKGTRLWNGQRGDVFVSELLAETIRGMDPEIDAHSAVELLNDAVKKAYETAGVDPASMEPEEFLQASVLLFSCYRREVWSFGDCMLRINEKNYRNIKKGDIMLADLRAFCVEDAQQKGIDINASGEEDYGRTQILPFLKAFTGFANSDLSFGYDCLNGGPIHKERVKVYQVQTGDFVVLASDGYPRLFDTLEETEDYLAKCLEEDPLCIYKLRGTKGIKKGCISYDDRCYISFTVNG
ncbi:MAG: toll/interleukin-1 receptor domain-containing protein [Lachnospiraceae bacterium]|nr:toll/interleukin-1 receptor domain-containing protein [Lachnospiraceae bacterium]